MTPIEERSSMGPRVFVVDDHAMVRTGVRAELGADVTVVGEAADVPTAIDGIRSARPDVVLLDVHMPGGGGRAVLEALRGELPEVKWLALSVSDAAEDVIAVIRAGARGYVTKTISGPDLLDAVRRVADGDVVFSPRLAGFVLDAFAAGGAAAQQPAAEEVSDPGLDLLSAREREVMQLLARGYTYREIGSRLFISVKTVESHASNVLRKLQLSNRNELTRWAATNRLL
ncbi:response regulator transcription factor [Blastococcus sp. KM273128]|uniref:response regulator transcription factor n=1 Tax=Blastococcus sp. KM273128 TaxID=2570314 RepID=UPI0027E1ECE0|nr:response regulator transcription factor [Blastococcus sp. KM273128]